MTITLVRNGRMIDPAKNVDQVLDLWIRGSEIRKEGVFERSFLLHYQNQQQRLRLRLPGEHGVMIALAAAVMLLISHLHS